MLPELHYSQGCALRLQRRGEWHGFIVEKAHPSEPNVYMGTVVHTGTILQSATRLALEVGGGGNGQTKVSQNKKVSHDKCLTSVSHTSLS